MSKLAIITYTITPCPLCGVDMPGQGTVTSNGSDLWTGWIGCTSCDYAVSGEGNTEFFAATATASKHKAALKKIKRHLRMLADALGEINGTYYNNAKFTCIDAGKTSQQECVG